ncbi:toprim domain-containing protein [uncultured Helicobacter sp.]|uniref:toprim domain-containing protein n=1 Tax=uncultured Helicobacter sp. TaxID=175537 RepID=UPI00374FBDAC
MQDLTTLPLHEVLLCNGYTLDRAKSSVRNPVLRNENGDKLVISKKGENYLYFNANSDSDRGNILSFARIRNLDVKTLIQNYDTNIDLAKEYKHNFFTTTKDPDAIHNEFKALKSLSQEDINNNILFKARGFDKQYMSVFANVIKQDERGNIVIPNYKLADNEFGESFKDKMIYICGYTKRLNYPITKDRNGIELEKPLKNLQKGSKGLEALSINKHAKEIKSIIISESIIDSLSLGQLRGFDPQTTMFLSTNGNFHADSLQKTLFAIIDKTPNAKITLAFDNDERGRAFRESLQDSILKATKKLPNTYKPFAKDCNDDLKIHNITGLKMLKEEAYQEWAYTKIIKYKMTKDTQTRAKLLNDFRRLDSLKPLNEENKQTFNAIRKHASIKGL